MSDTNSPRTRPPTHLVLLLGGISAFAALSIDMYLPAMAQMSKDLRAPDGAAEQTIAAFLIALALGQLFYGPLSDRIGRRLPLLAGMALFTVAAAACALVRSIDQLIVLRFLQALGACSGAVLARAVVRDRWEAKEVVSVLAFMTLVSGLGPVIAPLIGGAVMLLGDWRMVFYIQAGFGAVMLVVSALVLKESRSAEAAAVARGESVWTSYWRVLTNPRVLGYVLTGAFGASVMFVYISTAPNLLMGQYHLNPQQFSAMFFTTAVTMMACAQANRPLLRRFTPDQILSAANMVGIGGAVLLAVCAFTGFGGLWGILAPLVLLMGSRGLSMPNANAEALTAEQHRSGAVSALLGATNFVFGAAFAALAGVVYDRTARPMALVVLGAMVLATLSLKLVALKAKRA